MHFNRCFTMLAHRFQSKQIKIKKIKNKIKNEKKYYSEKIPTKLSWPMKAKSDKIFLFKKKKNAKLPWPMSAKSDT